MAKYIGYVGTYTKEESKGIYRFILDTDKEELNQVEIAAEIDNPTYVNVTNDNKLLYAVGKAGEEAGVSAFKINKEAAELSLLNSQTAPGSSPCHVSISNDNSTVVTANYHTTVVASYLTNEDGTLNPATSFIEHEGSGPHHRQEKPHMHYAGFTPDEKFVVAVDLGSDKVISYAIDNGTLTEAQVYHAKPGSGPRHITFHPSGKFAFVMTELSSEVISLQYNEVDGSFTELQTISTLPEDYNETNDGSAIHISDDGKFVYVGNRGHNSIAIFSVNQDTGILSFVDRVSSEGNWPRDFVIDPSQKYIVASNQKSNSLILYRRNEVTGKLTVIQTDVKVPEPVCIKFLNS